MHELAEVLTDRKGLTWIVVTAIFSVLVLVPFNQYQWAIAGLTLRPAAVLPVVCGILWGPAAAYGLAAGNVVGDYCGGSWSFMSVFGFLVNFLYPYLSYRLWHRLMRNREMKMDMYWLLCFWTTTLAVTFACMLFLAACGTAFFGRPFISKFIGYFGNNIFWAMIVGPVLLGLIFTPAVKNGFVYGREWERLQAGVKK